MYKFTEIALPLLDNQFFDLAGNPCALSGSLEPGAKPVPRHGHTLQTLLNLDQCTDENDTEATQFSTNNTSALTAGLSKKEKSKNKLDAKRAMDNKTALPEEDTQQPSADGREDFGLASSMLDFESAKCDCFEQLKDADESVLAEILFTPQPTTIERKTFGLASSMLDIESAKCDCFEQLKAAGESVLAEVLSKYQDFAKEDLHLRSAPS